MRSMGMAGALVLVGVAALRPAPVERPDGKALTNSIGMKLVRIPAGECLVGSPADEEDRRDEEKQRRVTIKRPFYLGVYEVTQGQYLKVMGKNPSVYSKSGIMKDDVVGLDTIDFPVEGVSWHDAQSFCEKLSALPAEKKAGRVYRLPTEEEWEYACRAGSATYRVFSVGDSLRKTDANFGAGDPGRPVKVGSYPANAFGLHDMHGNVWEWCADRYFGDKDDPTRVVKGGSFWTPICCCRSARRGCARAVQRPEEVGFRVVLATPG